MESENHKFSNFFIYIDQAIFLQKYNHSPGAKCLNCLRAS